EPLGDVLRRFEPRGSVPARVAGVLFRARTRGGPLSPPPLHLEVSMDWKSRVRTAFAGASHMPDDDVIEELAQHARAMYDTARADGCSHEEAEQRLVAQLDRWRLDAASLRRSSRRPPAVEPPRAASASSPLAGLSQDVNYSLRLLRRQPRFALLVTLTMALGISATTVLFSVTYSVLMKPLPWPNADRIVRLKETRGGIAPRFNSFTNAAYVAWGDEAD